MSGWRRHIAGVSEDVLDAVGPLDLAFDAMDLPAQPGLVLTAHTAEPGTPSADALALLARWSAAEPAPADRPTR